MVKKRKPVIAASATNWGHVGAIVGGMLITVGGAHFTPRSDISQMQEHQASHGAKLDSVVANQKYIERQNDTIIRENLRISALLGDTQ